MNKLKTIPAGREKTSGDAFVQREYSSQCLFQGAREIRIRHAGQEYRLRITQHDKLILTK